MVKHSPAMGRHLLQLIMKNISIMPYIGGEVCFSDFRYMCTGFSLIFEIAGE